MSDLFLNISKNGKYESKNLTGNEIKKYKMTKKEFLKSMII